MANGNIAGYKAYYKIKLKEKKSQRLNEIILLNIMMGIKKHIYEYNVWLYIIDIDTIFEFGLEIFL